MAEPPTIAPKFLASSVSFSIPSKCAVLAVHSNQFYGAFICLLDSVEVSGVFGTGLALTSQKLSSVSFPLLTQIDDNFQLDFSDNPITSASFPLLERLGDSADFRLDRLTIPTFTLPALTTMDASAIIHLNTTGLSANPFPVLSTIGDHCQFDMYQNAFTQSAINAMCAKFINSGAQSCFWDISQGTSAAPTAPNLNTLVNNQSWSIVHN